MTQSDQHTHLYLIRHGETNSNVNRLLHGATDVPLNDRGRDQAETIASRMAQLPGLQRIVASPLQRALHTAEAIERRTHLPLAIHAGLREMDFGAAEGLNFEQLEGEYPEESKRFLDPTDIDARYPDGESRQEFFTRVESTIDDIATNHAGEHVVVVTHGGFIAAVLAILLRDDPNNWRERPIVNTSLTHIELAIDGPIAHLVNDAVHLEQMTLTDVSGEE